MTLRNPHKFPPVCKRTCTMLESQERIIGCANEVLLLIIRINKVLAALTRMSRNMLDHKAGLLDDLDFVDKLSNAFQYPGSRHLESDLRIRMSSRNNSGFPGRGNADYSSISSLDNLTSLSRANRPSRLPSACDVSNQRICNRRVWVRSAAKTLLLLDVLSNMQHVQTSIGPDISEFAVGIFLCFPSSPEIHHYRSRPLLTRGPFLSFLASINN